MLKATFLPTVILNQAPLRSVAQSQRQLADAQKELGTGRKADLALALGAGTQSLLDMQALVDESTSIQSTNARVALRLNASQSAMQSLSDSAGQLFSVLTAAIGGATDIGVLESQARSSMSMLVEKLGTQVDGVHVFSGTNVETAPLSDHLDPASTSKTSIVNAFVAQFGFAPGDAQASAITPAQMQNFLSTQFEAQFADPAWTANWSSASSSPLRDRISTSEVTDTSATANDPAFRLIAKAYAMVSDLGLGQLSAASRDLVVKTATSTLANGMDGVTALQGNLGQVQQRVKDATTSLADRSAVLSSRVEELQGVDPAEISTRISALLSNIETSYAITARLQNISLVQALR